jgi:hypothetical protein
MVVRRCRGKRRSAAGEWLLWFALSGGPPQHLRLHARLGEWPGGVAPNTPPGTRSTYSVSSGCAWCLSMMICSTSLALYLLRTKRHRQGKPSGSFDGNLGVFDLGPLGALFMWRPSTTGRRYVPAKGDLVVSIRQSTGSRRTRACPRKRAEELAFAGPTWASGGCRERYLPRRFRQT